MSNIKTTYLLFTVAICVCLAASVRSAENDNWPAFRGGESRATVDDDPRLPTAWSTTENVVWKSAIPGLGWSSPIIWNDLIFLTTVVNTGDEEEPRMGLYFPYGSPQPMPPGGRFRLPEEGELMERSGDLHHWLVTALDFKSGAVIWNTEVNAGIPQFDRHLKNTYASSTPVTDGQYVYAYFGNVGVFALDFDGNVMWEKRFDAADTRLGWGPASSPILHEDTLYIINDNDEQSFLLALDTKSGNERWRINRAEGTNWSTPFLWNNSERTEIVTAGSDHVRSYSLHGQELWKFTGLNTISIPQPFSAHGMLYVTSGYVGDQIKPVYAIRPGASGDITLLDGQTSNSHIVWYQDSAGPYHPTPLVYGDYYFTLLDRGFFTVHDAQTGEELYFTEQQIQTQEVRSRIAPGATGFTSSPWAYNGNVFVLSEDGDTYALDSNNRFRVVSVNSLEEVAMSTPAIARGSLFIRTRSTLWRLSNDTTP